MLLPPIAPDTTAAVAASPSVLSFMAANSFEKDEFSQKFHTSVSVYNESESYPALFLTTYSLRDNGESITWVAVSGTSVTLLYNAGVSTANVNRTWYYHMFQHQVPANIDSLGVSVNFAASIGGGGLDIRAILSSWKLRSETPEITMRSSIGTITGASAGQDYTINVSTNVPSSAESMIWLITSRSASAGAIPVSVQDTVKRTDNPPAVGNMFHLQGSDAVRTGFSVSCLPNVNAANNHEVALFEWQVSCA